VLKQVFPQMCASSTTSFVDNLCKRLAGEASKLAKLRKTSTLSFKDIQTSVRLRLPGVNKFAAK
jgi:histone H3/H4